MTWNARVQVKSRVVGVEVHDCVARLFWLCQVDSEVTFGYDSCLYACVHFTVHSVGYFLFSKWFRGLSRGWERLQSLQSFVCRISLSFHQILRLQSFVDFAVLASCRSQVDSDCCAVCIISRERFRFVCDCELPWPSPLRVCASLCEDRRWENLMTMKRQLRARVKFCQRFSWIQTWSVWTVQCESVSARFLTDLIEPCPALQVLPSFVWIGPDLGKESCLSAPPKQTSLILVW